MPRRTSKLPSILRWAGTTAAALIAIAWIASARWAIGGSNLIGETSARIGAGRLRAARMVYSPGHPRPPHHRSTVQFRQNTEPWSWWFTHEQIVTSISSDGPVSMSMLEVLSIPMWVPLALVALPTALAWRRHLRRIPPDHCPRCRYNLAGLPPNSPCPECGAPHSA